MAALPTLFPNLQDFSPRAGRLLQRSNTVAIAAVATEMA